ncbi:MAG: hypothetical protein KAJ75_06170 [Alphaproteobacteria bacterium]|nr:hypothetical protein [Alphaproteobacteria bacterium]
MVREHYITNTDTFTQALETVFGHEGVLSEDERDAGGTTKYGVSLRWLKSIGELDIDGDGYVDADINHDGIVDANDIRAMTREQAAEFYRHHWWERYHYDELPPIIAVKTFDLAVNMGSVQAHKCLQRACRSVGCYLVDDGIIGSRTRAAINKLKPKHRQLLTAFRSEAAGYYRLLIAIKPVFECYQNGWLNRAYS